jgi:hemerythrin superfamily protein
MDTDPMDMNPVGNRQSEGFPVDQPLQALEKDHHYVRELFGHFLNTQDVLVRQQAGPQILLALEMHAALEEAVFYPHVRSVDPALVTECEEEHGQADQLIRQLKGMDVTDPQCDRMFRHLCDAVLHHIEAEENRLFPKLRQSSMDMEALGLEMQAFESNMVAQQAQQSERKDASAGRSLP